jgi:integrase
MRSDLLAYRHGLRAAEVVDLRWEQVDLKRRRCTSGGSRTATPPVFSLIGERAGLVADLGIKLRAHMPRHSTGSNDALMMLRLNIADPTS